MPRFVDARIPVVFGVVPGAGDAVFTPDPAVQAHPAGCSCCIARSPAAAALHALFLRRVRGEVAWFTRVVVPDADPALRAAIEADPVTSARFRLD